MKNYILALLVLINMVSCKNERSGNNYQRPVPYKVQPVFIPLPFGSIEPKGWLRDWCETAKNGLILNNPAIEAGWFDKQPDAWKKKQADYWMKDIKDFKKAWLYGQPPFTLSEQTAYWIDGMLRMGIALHDSDLMNRALADVHAVIKNKSLEPGGWSSSIYQRAVMAYYMNTKDTIALNYLNSFLKTTQFNGFGGAEIWTEFLSPERLACIHETEPRDIVQTETMFEIYSFTGDTAVLNHALKNLKRYENHFVNFWNTKYSDTCNYISPNGCVYKMHGVSYNEMAKLWAIAYLYNANTDYLKASENAYKLLDSLHIMPHGVNSAMENIAGVDAIIPTETCDVSDYINSVLWMFRITGQSGYGDRIEKAFFNAAPAAASHDYKTHVYFQSPNALSLKGKWAFQELHDPLCCSGNQARMIPNYLLHMLMATNDGGLAFNLYGPCKADIRVGNQVDASVEVTTKYPFEESISVKVMPNKTVQFPFYFRMPSWCKNPSLTVNGKSVELKTDEKGFAVINRKWHANDLVALALPKSAEVKKSETTSNNAFGSTNVTQHLKATAGIPYATVEYGPLLFALKVSENTKYNYAFADEVLKVNNIGITDRWTWEYAPIEIVANAVPFNWENAPALPSGTVHPNGMPVKLTLIPYGCTEGTRITMFSYVK